MTYGLIHWGNSSHAEMVFKMQKRVVRLMMGHGYRELHQVNLAIYGKEVYHMAEKVFNRLPYNLKEISNNPKMVNLKDFLSSNSFYTLEEFFKR
jgi:hypothetical protein